MTNALKTITVFGITLYQTSSPEDVQKLNQKMGWTQSILDCRPEKATMEWLDSCSDNSDHPSIAQNAELGA